MKRLRRWWWHHWPPLMRPIPDPIAIRNWETLEAVFGRGRTYEEAREEWAAERRAAVRARAAKDTNRRMRWLKPR
jgi:hypothetical protein